MSCQKNDVAAEDQASIDRIHDVHRVAEGDKDADHAGHHCGQGLISMSRCEILKATRPPKSQGARPDKSY